MKTQLTGIYPALITPMNEDGTAVAYPTLRRLLEWHLERKVDGFFVCGGSGEGLLLEESERREVLETIVDQLEGRAAVIAHIGALATQTAQRLARHAASLDVAAVAAVPPVYFRVDPSALVDHYRMIAESAAGVPVFVYNIPSATGVEINAALMEQLMQIPGIGGIKYSSYNLFDLQRIIGLGGDISVLSGFDEVCVAGLAMGAHGAIGSTYNVLPATFAALYRAASRGDWEHARRLQERANRMIEALLSAPLIAGLKAVLTAWGFDSGAPRRPQRPLSDAERSGLLAAVEEADLAGLETECLAELQGDPGVAESEISGKASDG